MFQHTPLASPIARHLSTAVLAPLLSSRSTGITIVGAAALHSGLVFLGLPSWHCPIRHGLGVPCPGCGLSRAATALVQGDWQMSLSYHAFAPLLLTGLLLVAGVSLLSSSQRRHVIEWVDLVERRTGITAIVLIAFVFYWLVRLVLFNEAFINLIMN